MYGGRQLYQYNEDDFRYQAFKQQGLNTHKPGNKEK